MRAKMPRKLWFLSRLASHSHLTPIQRGRWARANIGMVCMLIVTPILLSLIALLTDWDLALADAAFDSRLNAFPLRHAWLTEVFNHMILKRVFTAFALAFIIAAVWDWVSPRTWSWLRRFQFRVVALSAVLVPTVISILKLISDSHCPWDLERYGGTEPYVRLFEYFPAGIEPGHCMPAGHTSSALWMISISIFFIPHQLTRAGIVLAALLVVGFGVGWMQQLRGAHFFTHTLWSLWFALFTVFLITTCMDRWPVRGSTL